MRVGYTLEQCWHDVPGGTAVAALEVAAELVGAASATGLELVGVAGTHRDPPVEPWVPPVTVHALPGAGARLYARWLWTARPLIELATGPVDVAHATTIIPCASRAPLVVTVHDLAFLHEPDHFTRWGVALFRRSLTVIRRRAALVLCSSTATMDDCESAGIGGDRLRLVPLGVRVAATSASDTAEALRLTGGLRDYLVFVGTLEPRKNLTRLIEAVGRSGLGLPLVVVGPPGWGDTLERSSGATPVVFVGQVDEGVRNALVAGAAMLCYPSLREGFGLPVLEAMALGTPVVTSRGTATEETAAGAAALVDPTDVDDIAFGITEAVRRRVELRAAGRERAALMTWAETARATLAAYREVAP